MPGLDFHSAAHRCLAAADPAEKVSLTHAVAADWRAGRLAVAQGAVEAGAIAGPGIPERPRRVDPRQLPRRGLGTEQGRAALLHAVAHIEFNAINLAWDAVLRFRDMPTAFIDDWVGVADDEARHFSLVVARLGELGRAYGDFDAHDGLWDMARRTAHSCLERMALVPRVLEARGLDVTPGMIARLRNAGDTASVALLEIILREEEAHVAAGSRWFAWCCARAGLEPEATFAALVAEHSAGALRGPFNIDARLRAGFSPAELDHLQALVA